MQEFRENMLLSHNHVNYDDNDCNYVGNDDDSDDDDV